MTDNNQMTLKKKSRNKRKTRKIALLFFLTGITAILLIVETYAWFVGTTTITVNDFEIGVSSGDAFLMSLNGEDWSNELTITSEKIAPTEGGYGADTAYEGHTNKWVGELGLIPLSTSGVADNTNGGRLKLYGKSSLTATGGGFRLISNRIKNYGEGAEGTATEQDGYVAFDLFIKNGTGVDYIKEYNRADDEAIYLLRNSTVKVDRAGDPSITDDYGLANSVRVAFVQIGRVAATTEAENTIQSITCAATDTGDVTSLCTEEGNVTIWEPNETKHHTELVNYFNRVCKTKTVDAGTTTYGDTACKPVAGTGSNPASELADGKYVNTYVVNDDIPSSAAVDIYDGLNGHTPDEVSKLLVKSETFTDAMKNTADANRPAFFYIAPNSITKIRVYIYLEGQDVDNYDLASNGKKITVNFGFTKDQWNLNGTDSVPGA